MTYITHCRQLALSESKALRGYAKAGKHPPPYVPIDYWDDWVNHTKANTATFGRKTAA